ncbi:MAG: TolC family protein [Planctomycetes bacterium]|nr:TolC family protein [Planctomycetota bacterium]
MSARVALPVVLLLTLPACVGYEADAADAALVAAEVAARPGGSLDVDAAFELALRANPEVRAREAEARAAGAETTVPQTLNVEYRGREQTLAPTLDPIALLGLGPRGAAIDAADARLAEALADLATARWRTLVAVAECFLVDAALAALDVPDLALDVRAFEQAGLAAPVAVAELTAAQARARSEAVALERARTDNRADLRRLLGLDRSAALELLPVDPDWPRQPHGSPGELLARPDLRLATARFEVADARFREAVAAQFPSLRIGPDVSLRGDPLNAMGMLQIPFGMDGLAAAARERRSAAREALAGAFLTAQQEVARADARLATAEADTAATATALRASATSLAASRVALEVEPDAFEPFVRAAQRALGDFREHRQAVVEVARARARRAEAWGWPASSDRADPAGEAASVAGGGR